MDIYIGMLLFFGIPMVMTIPAAIILCRYRATHKKQISYGTTLAAASCVPLLLAIAATCMEPDIWWSREHKSSPEEFLVMLAFLTIMCILPALCVVVHYQRKIKREPLSRRAQNNND